MFQFAEDDYKKIEAVLEGRFIREEHSRRIVLDNPEEKRRLSMEIFSGIPIGRDKGNLISVYTESAHLQLHFCTGYVASDVLGEVTFVAEGKGRLCGLIIEKGAACSLYANVDTKLLSGDFTRLGPEVMLSGIALSLAENVLPERLFK
ncbi:MAG TPA: hypothetical protein VGB38_08035 [bacterium]